MPGAERVDDAGTIDAWDERKHGPARALIAGPQAHVEHPIDGGGMNADADFTRARLGVRHALVFEHVRRAVVVDDDRFHAPPSSVRIFKGVEIARRRLAPSIDDDAVPDALASLFPQAGEDVAPFVVMRE